MNKIHQKSFSGAKNAGFTLIELLVVVLIIGILSAVALPQYTKAVNKARLTQVITVMDALKKGIDVYAMSNGYQTISGGDLVSSLDIDATNHINCSTGTCLSDLGGNWKVMWSISGSASSYLVYATIYQPGGSSIPLMLQEILDSTGKWVKYCVVVDSSDSFATSSCQQLRGIGWSTN